MSDHRSSNPSRPSGPRPRGGLADLAEILADLAELLAGETPGSRRFLRGLVVGGLVGAAVAGGSLLRGRRRPEGHRRPEAG